MSKGIKLQAQGNIKNVHVQNHYRLNTEKKILTVLVDYLNVMWWHTKQKERLTGWCQYNPKANPKGLNHKGQVLREPVLSGGSSVRKYIRMTTARNNNLAINKIQRLKIHFQIVRTEQLEECAYQQLLGLSVLGTGLSRRGCLLT